MGRSKIYLLKEIPVVVDGKRFKLPIKRKKKEVTRHSLRCHLVCKTRYFIKREIRRRYGMRRTTK